MANERLPPTLRQAVTERVRGCCEYYRSQERFAMQAFALEHVVPRSLGGETTLGNLALACQGCNNHKYNKTEGQDPASGSRVLLFNPRIQRWRDHFAGMVTFPSGVILITLGDQTITATDTISGITGTAIVTVQPPARGASEFPEKGSGVVDGGSVASSQATTPAGSGMTEGDRSPRLLIGLVITDPSEHRIGPESPVHAQPHHIPLSRVDQLFLEEGLIG